MAVAYTNSLISIIVLVELLQGIYCSSMLTSGTSLSLGNLSGQFQPLYSYSFASATTSLQRILEANF